jgi:RHS repeat-associated protein
VNKLSNITEGYSYDPIYELTQVVKGGSTSETYSYDAVGNRLSSLTVPSYSYNPSNELTSSSSGSYTYDNNGNTLTDASGKSYTWDFENRLIQAIAPGTGTTTFKYDPLGRRIQKSGPLGTTNYLYSGPNPIEEMDNAGNGLARYTQGPDVDQPVSEFRSGTSSYYEADALGTITSLTNSAGTLVSSYTYDAFGKLTASTGTLTNPFQYTGRDYDAETSLRYYRARYYDPTVGRFVSEDPMRFSASPNYYSYVENRPVNATDPMGLTIRICNRGAQLWIPNANHSYFYDTRNHRTCGRGINSGIENPGAPGTFCVDVPGSDGHEDSIMKCCNKTADQGMWFPGINDCHNSLDRCLKGEGIANPGAPGGRMGCRGNCPPPIPYPEHEHFMSGW